MFHDLILTAYAKRCSYLRHQFGMGKISYNVWRAMREDVEKALDIRCEWHDLTAKRIKGYV